MVASLQGVMCCVKNRNKEAADANMQRGDESVKGVRGSNEKQRRYFYFNRMEDLDELNVVRIIFSRRSSWK